MASLLPVSPPLDKLEAGKDHYGIAPRYPCAPAMNR